MMKVIGVLAGVTILFALGCGGGGSMPPAPALPPAPAKLPAPGANNFTAVGDLATARAGHKASLLPNGMVLIAGGVGDGSQPLASAELYDPSTRRFTPTSNMHKSRTRHTAILLANGKVLIAGGYSTWPTPTSRAEIYKPPAVQSNGKDHEGARVSGDFRVARDTAKNR